MHNTTRWVPAYLLVLGELFLVNHLSLGSDALAIDKVDKDVSPDTTHYEGKVLPTDSVNFPHIVSLRLRGITPFRY